VQKTDYKHDLRHYSIPDRREYKGGVSLTIDSGWNRSFVEIDVCTTRGQSVTLTPEQWRELNAKVEAIIAHCEERRAAMYEKKL
jgi:hypothetical protein